MSIYDEIRKMRNDQEEARKKELENARKQYPQFVSKASNQLYQEIKKSIISSAMNYKVTQTMTGIFSYKIYSFYEGHTLFYFYASDECRYYSDNSEGICHINGTADFLKDVLFELIKLLKEENVILCLESSYYELTLSNADKFAKKCWKDSEKESRSVELRIKGQLPIRG